MSFVNTRHFLLEDYRDLSAGNRKQGKQDMQRSEEKTIKLELEEVSKHMPNARYLSNQKFGTLIFYMAVVTYNFSDKMCCS